MSNQFTSLADYLARTGTTQTELAEAVGTSQGQISRYAAGLELPRPRLALRISEHTGVPVEALLRAYVGGAA